MNITFVGGGNMASALISGLLNHGTSSGDISVVEVDSGNRRRLEESFGVKTFPAISADALNDVLVLAVKPQQLQEVASVLAPLISTRLVVSIAAGVRSETLASWLGGCGNIVRVMPNTPAQVMAGISGLYAMPAVDAAGRETAAAILSAVGKIVWLEKEEEMDAVTAISGSGPAYVFYFLEALEEAGIELGLSAEVASSLAVETFSGAVKLLQASGESPPVLRGRVTSKGGTTERALFSMEESGVKRNIVEAAKAAAYRSQELGDLLGK